jgi:hypothetical protein
MTDFTGIDANHDGKISQEEFDAAQEKEAKRKAKCCNRESWEKILYHYKILIGVSCIFVSLYDYIVPLIRKTEVQFEIRSLTIDFYFLVFGLILILGSTCAKGIMKYFGFLETSTGMALSLLFSGFLLIKQFDFLLMETYFGCYILTGSLVYFFDIFVRGCCLREKQIEEGSGPETEGLLANEAGSPISKTNL